MSSSVVVRAVLWATMVALVVYADDYCCSPDQFVIEAGQLQGLSISGKGLAQVNGLAMALDFKNKKVGEEIVSTTSGYTSKIKIIIDYSNNVMYTIMGQTCTKTEAPDDYQQCIPKDAKFVGSSSLGNNELIIDNYSYYENIPKVLTGNVSLGVSHKDCIPVRAGIVGEATQVDPPIPLVSGTGYANYKSGISDPGRWFNIPSICQKGKSGRFARESAASDANAESMHHLVTLINHIVLAPFHRK